MTRCEEICRAAPGCEPCRSGLLAVPLGVAPDGHAIVGAMDGWTTVVAVDAELARVDRTMRRELA